MSRRPRLLILVTLAEAGGVVSYLTSLLPAVGGRFDVVVAAYGPGPLEAAARAAGARFVPLRHVRRPINLWHDLLGLIELVRICRRERPDILHANSAKAGLLGRLAATVTGVPIRIFNAHGWAFATHPGRTSWLYLWGERMMRPLTTVTLCVAESERERGLRAGACAPDRTVVIWNGIDVNSAKSSRREAGPPLLVTVGRFKAPKDFLTFVRGLAVLERGSFEAVVVGDGPDRGPLEEELERLGLEHAVDLVGERDDVPELLAGADVFVLSTTSEAMPISVLEAMAAGVPVVASAVGGVKELVVDGETGFLVPPRNPAALGTALRRLVADPALRRRMGAAGRARARSTFDVEIFRSAHLDLYRRELAERGLPLPAPYRYRR